MKNKTNTQLCQARRSPRIAFLLVLLLITCIMILPLLTSCGADVEYNASSNDGVGTGSASDSIRADAYQIQIAYYEEQMKQLQEELLRLKEEQYILTADYKEQIQNLEEELRKAESNNSSIAVSGNDIPKVNRPDTPEPTAQFDKNHFEYHLSGNEIVIDKYIGSDQSVQVPSKIDGYPVGEIGEGAFRESTCQTVVLPSSVHTVGWFAFYGCSTLKEISLPANVRSIGYAAFDGCPTSMVIHCPANSYASAYAGSYGLRQNNTNE